MKNGISIHSSDLHFFMNEDDYFFTSLLFICLSSSLLISSGCSSVTFFNFKEIRTFPQIYGISFGLGYNHFGHKEV